MNFTKKIIGLLIAFFISGGLFAQSNSVDRIKFQNFTSSKLKKAKSRTLASEKEQLDSLVTQALDENGTLQNYSKSMFEYDMEGNLTASIDYLWDTAEESWVEDERWVVSYNEDDQPASIVLYDWDESVSEWVLSSKEERIYNAAGLLSESIYSSWDSSSNQWVNDYRVVYTYNSNDLLVSIEDFTYDEDSSAWQQLSIWEYTYNNGLVASRTFSLFVDGEKTPSQKIEYTYSPDDLLIETNTYSWSEEWLLVSQTQYTYNTSGQLVEEIIYTNTDELMPETRFVYSYPFTVDLDMLVLPDLLYGFNNVADQEILANTSEYAYDQENEEWELISKSMVYFSEFDDDVTALTLPKDELNFTIYPNPAIDVVFVSSDLINGKVSDLEIVDMHGNIILKSDQLILPGSVNLNGIQKGVYYVRLNGTNESNTQKLIVR